MVTAIPAVLTPLTGSFDPVPLSMLQIKSGSHLCALDKDVNGSFLVLGFSQAVEDTARNQAIDKPDHF